MPYLVECLDGPVRERIPSGYLVLLEIKPCFYIQLPDGKWVYYYQVFSVPHPFPLETKVEGSQKGRKKGSSRKNLPQAHYKYSKYFGAVPEDHQDVQVHIKSYASRFHTRPPKLD